MEEISRKEPINITHIATFKNFNCKMSTPQLQSGTALNSVTRSHRRMIIRNITIEIFTEKVAGNLL